MTFKDWQNTPEGEESLDRALEESDACEGIYVDNLMFSDYKASDYWQQDQHPEITAAWKKAKEQEKK